MVHHFHQFTCCLHQVVGEESHLPTCNVPSRPALQLHVQKDQSGDIHGADTDACQDAVRQRLLKTSAPILILFFFFLPHTYCLNTLVMPGGHHARDSGFATAVRILRAPMRSQEQVSHYACTFFSQAHSFLVSSGWRRRLPVLSICNRCDVLSLLLRAPVFIDVSFCSIAIDVLRELQHACIVLLILFLPSILC
jgi:hypothetical protein